MSYILDYSNWNRLFEQSSNTELTRLELQQVPEYRLGGKLDAEKDGRDVELIVATFNGDTQVVIKNNEAVSQPLGGGYNIVGGRLREQNDFTSVPTEVQFFITNEPFTGPWNQQNNPRKGTPMQLDKTYQIKETVVGTVQLIKMAIDACNIPKAIYGSKSFKNNLETFINNFQEIGVKGFVDYDKNKVADIIATYIS